MRLLERAAKIGIPIMFLIFSIGYWAIGFLIYLELF